MERKVFRGLSFKNLTFTKGSNAIGLIMIIYLVGSLIWNTTNSFNDILLFIIAGIIAIGLLLVFNAFSGVIIDNEGVTSFSLLSRKKTIIWKDIKSVFFVSKQGGKYYLDNSTNIEKISFWKLGLLMCISTHDAPPNTTTELGKEKEVKEYAILTSLRIDVHELILSKIQPLSSVNRDANS